MRSILSKILGLLFALNLALWLFVFISDDFVPNQVENKRDTLNLSASLYAQLALPILLNEDLNDFKKWQHQRWAGQILTVNQVVTLVPLSFIALLGVGTYELVFYYVMKIAILISLTPLSPLLR